MTFHLLAIFIHSVMWTINAEVIPCRADDECLDICELPPIDSDTSVLEGDDTPRCEQGKCYCDGLLAWNVTATCEYIGDCDVPCSELPRQTKKTGVVSGECANEKCSCMGNLEWIMWLEKKPSNKVPTPCYTNNECITTCETPPEDIEPKVDEGDSTTRCEQGKCYCTALLTWNVTAVCSSSDDCWSPCDQLPKHTKNAGDSWGICDLDKCTCTANLEWIAWLMKDQEYPPKIPGLRPIYNLTDSRNNVAHPVTLDCSL